MRTCVRTVGMYAFSLLSEGRGGSFNGVLVTKELIKESETDRREGRAYRRAEG